ncbi:TRAP transporter small permease subunit [Roseibium aggregatum]|uniref:TRAP transporter small permease protein n=1 Tax=Roseibium aggregatum TaxID=187304 RepID=A0A939ED92_9HYPH|nr:TRAP transporter small permease [Roseibium aggregatum]MBN9669474.1 TRAP transporter small permease [Roseibium aggregatum]
MTFRWLDRLSDGIAWIAAWALFVVGLMLGYEVIARYFFNAPTIWAEEMSRILMVWAVFMAGASLMRKDAQIRVTILTDLLGPGGKLVARLVSLVFVVGVSALLVRYGIKDPVSSLEHGRTTGTMLDPPAWIMQASVPAGFALVCVQGLVEIVRTLRGDRAAERSAADHMAG